MERRQRDIEAGYSRGDRRTTAAATIVLVHPDVMLIQAMRSLLEQTLGFKVLGEAPDTEAAVELVARVRPDVVICGVSLPGVHPAHLANRLADVFPDGPCVLAVSRSWNSSVIADAVCSPIRGYLLTPETDAAALASAIDSLMHGLSVWGPGVRQFITQMVQHTPSSLRAPRLKVQLTARERLVLELLAQGLTTREMAAHLSVGVRTVQLYVARLLSKLGVNSRMEAVMLATALKPGGDEHGQVLVDRET